MSINKKIKMIRQLKGYKQEFMAIKLGISQKQYSIYEQDGANLEWKIIEKIALIMEIKIVNLICFDETQVLHNFKQANNDFTDTTCCSLDMNLSHELSNQLKVKDEQIKHLLQLLEEITLKRHTI